MELISNFTEQIILLFLNSKEMPSNYTTIELYYH